MYFVHIRMTDSSSLFRSRMMSVLLEALKLVYLPTVTLNCIEFGLFEQIASNDDIYF